MTTNTKRKSNLSSFGNVNFDGLSVSISNHNMSVFNCIDFVLFNRVL